MNSSATHRRRHVRKVTRVGYHIEAKTTSGVNNDWTVSIPADADIVVWMISGYDVDTSDRLGEVSDFTMDLGGDNVAITPIVASNVNAGGGTNAILIADVSTYRGTSITFREDGNTASGWSSGVTATLVFYKNVNNTSLSDSAYVSTGTDVGNADAAERTTGAMSTVPNGMVLAMYRYFLNDGSGDFTSGVTEVDIDEGGQNNQNIIWGEAATNGTNVTCSGDGGSINYHDIVAVCLTPI